LAEAEGWKIVAPLRPRFRDTDAMGHINNAVYVTYLEVARQEYWREFKQDDNYRVVPFILAHVDIDFRSEAHMHETLELCIRCSYVGTRSFGFDYAIRTAACAAAGGRGAHPCRCSTTTRRRRACPVRPRCESVSRTFEGRAADARGALMSARRTPVAARALSRRRFVTLLAAGSAAIAGLARARRERRQQPRRLLRCPKKPATPPASKPAAGRGRAAEGVRPAARQARATRSRPCASSRCLRVATCRWCSGRCVPVRKER
jgi:acyl-CoA thioester hydrolase